MMKIKQTNLFFIGLGLVVSMLMGMFLTNAPTAQAYVCHDPENPTDIYEYHESDGKCWKVRYTDSGKTDPPATCTNGNCVCPGGAPLVLNGQCKLSCSPGEQYHADNNTCWYKNGYTQESTQNVQPTHNDGSPIQPNNSACSDGFVYLPNGNGSNGPGCYHQRANDGTFPCGPNQRVKVNRGGHTCEDTGKEHLIPKDKQQSADKTKISEECAKKYPGDENVAQRIACQSAANNPDQDCNQQPNEEMKKACLEGKKNPNRPPSPPNNNNATGTGCGEADTVLISCTREKGIVALGDVLRIIITVLSVLIGIAATGGIAWAAILYSKAEDNASNVSEAKDMIRNVVIGIIVYGFMVAIINWLVPGGVIG